MTSQNTENMSGIDNPLKNLTQISRNEYKGICQRIEDDDKNCQKIIDQMLQRIREEVKIQFESNKARLLERGGSDHFLYPYSTWSCTRDYGSNFTKKFIGALTDELKTTLSAALVAPYRDEIGIVQFKIPLVSD